MRLRNRMAGAVTAGLAALALALGTAPAGAAGPSDGLPYAGSTGVGVHNAYEKAKYPYCADALDSGAAMLELDVWTNFFGSSWRVSHNNPLRSATPTSTPPPAPEPGPAAPSSPGSSSWS